ncbi:MAG: hypothetical protein OEW12_07100 [Deltaproteobacteria bacterium]|nr:hypothetical protein [Deltaproteobacteria bacterium]
MPDQPPLPPLITLPALQGYVRLAVAAREFTTDVNEIFILLVEEVGELAAEFKKARFYPERHNPAHLALEIADILLFLMDLANGFGVDLEGLWGGHEAENDRRFASRREATPPVEFRPGMGINALAAHLEAKRQERGFEDDPPMLTILLMEEVGELATEIRKSWKGLATPVRAGHEIIDCITYLLRLAHHMGVDVEQAVVHKETINQTRRWDY